MLDSEFAHEIVSADVEELLKAEESYGDSWKRRGGVDSFMMLARKWDRIEYQVRAEGFNILETCKKDTRPDGIMDDIRDLRRYLILVEHEVLKNAQTQEEAKEEVPGEATGGYVHQDGDVR